MTSKLASASLPQKAEIISLKLSMTMTCANAYALKETCQMTNHHMGWEGAHCATHKKRVRATLMPGVLFACRFSMATWLWINDLLMAQKVFVLHAA